MVFYSSRSGLRTGAGLMKKEKSPPPPLFFINGQFILPLLISIKCRQCKCLNLNLIVQDHVSPRCRSLRSNLAFLGSKILLKNKSEACLFCISKNNNRQSLLCIKEARWTPHEPSVLPIFLGHGAFSYKLLSTPPPKKKSYFNF